MGVFPNKGPWVLAVIILAATLVVSAAITLWIVPSVNTAVEGRREEKQFQRAFSEDALRVLGGEAPIERKDFPNTPSGEVQEILHGYMEKVANLKRKYEVELMTLGWEWVLSPESLSSRANLEECLRRIRKAQTAATLYERNCWQAAKVACGALKKRAQSNRLATKACEQLARNLDGSSSEYRALKREFQVVLDNFSAAEALCAFLLGRIGQYKVSDDGAVEFNERVPEAVVKEFDSIVDRLNSTEELLNRLDAERTIAAKREWEWIRDWAEN